VQRVTPFREKNKTVIGVIGLATILTLLYTSFNTDKLPFIGAGPIYKADFSEGAGVQKMDEVRVAGVKVGKVIKIDLSGDHVVVQMRVKGATLGRLTRAEIRIKTVLGRKYVQLDPAGDGTLDPSSEIPVSRTTSPFDIAPAFQQLAGTVGNIDGAQLGKAFTTLANDFRDSPKDVRASLDGLSRLSMTIASRDAQLKRLLEKARGVTQTLAARDQDLVSLLKDSDLIFQEVQARREAIHHLLVSTTALSEQLVALVQENIATLAPALHSLRSVVTVLRNNQDNLDKSIAQLAPFVRLFANNLGNGRWFDTFVQNETSPTGFGPGSFGKP
jgi:phospholipid/cholesterol/gamma-HCH transport system substrate-binding protein